jgi:hypothetical protein
MRSFILALSTFGVLGPQAVLSGTIPTRLKTDADRRIVRTMEDVVNLPEGLIYNITQMPRAGDTAVSHSMNVKYTKKDRALRKRLPVNDCKESVSATFCMSAQTWRLMGRQPSGTLPLLEDCQSLGQLLSNRQETLIVPGLGMCHKAVVDTCTAAVCNLGCDDIAVDSDDWTDITTSLTSDCLYGQNLVGTADDTDEPDLLFILEYQGDELPAYQNDPCTPG